MPLVDTAFAQRLRRDENLKASERDLHVAPSMDGACGGHRNRSKIGFGQPLALVRTTSNIVDLIYFVIFTYQPTETNTYE